MRTSATYTQNCKYWNFEIITSLFRCFRRATTSFVKHLMFSSDKIILNRGVIKGSSDFILVIRLLFNPIQDGLFRGCSRMGGSQKGPTSLKSVTHIPQWWNLAQLYLTQRRSKNYMNHVTHHLSSADISIFSPEISKFCYIKKYIYRLYFDT